MFEESAIVGIDFGTCSIRAAVLDDGDVLHVGALDCEQRNEIPFTSSCISFYGNEITIGIKAKEIMKNHPEYCVENIKRLIGSRTEETDVENTRVSVKIDEDTVIRFYPEELLAFILNEIKESVNKSQERQIQDYTVAVPFEFDTIHHQAIIDAGKLVDLNVFDLMFETEAAANAESDEYPMEDALVLYIDAGGGKTEISLIRQKNVRVSSELTLCDMNLGGIHFTENLENYCINEFKNQKRIKEENFKEISLILLREECEKAMIRLSSLGVTEYEVSVANFHESRGLKIKVNREIFEKVNETLFKRFDSLCSKMRDMTKKRGDQIENIVFIGGCSNIPQLQNLIKKHFQETLRTYYGYGLVAKGSTKSSRYFTLIEIHEPDVISKSNLTRERRNELKIRVKNLIEKSKTQKLNNRLKSDVKNYALELLKLFKNTDTQSNKKLKVDPLASMSKMREINKVVDAEERERLIEMLENFYDEEGLNDLANTYALCQRYEKLKNRTALLVRRCVFHKLDKYSKLVPIVFKEARQIRAITIDFGVSHCNISSVGEITTYVLSNEPKKFETQNLLHEFTTKSIPTTSHLDTLFIELNEKSLSKNTAEKSINGEKFYHIMKYLYDRALTYVGKNEEFQLTPFVFTVPVPFTDDDRYIYETVIMDLGIKITFLPETIAISIACVHKNLTPWGSEQKFLLICIGASKSYSLYISSQRMNIRERKRFPIDLNGDTITHTLIEYCLSRFPKTIKDEIKNNPNTYFRLKKACENAKLKISGVEKYGIAYIELAQILEGVNINEKITTPIFEDLIKDLLVGLYENLTSMHEYIIDLTLPTYLRTILIGSTCGVYQVKRLIKNFLQDVCYDFEIYDGYLAANGASIYAGVSNGDNVLESELKHVNEENEELEKFVINL